MINLILTSSEHGTEFLLNMRDYHYVLPGLNGKGSVIYMKDSKVTFEVIETPRRIEALIRKVCS